MATGLNLQMYRNVPGYKGILKVVLKSQIQMLVEQLAEQTGEESIVLSASVEEGTLTHLGSASGNVFITCHDDFKKQFLGFCLKRHTVSTVKPAKQNQSSLGNTTKTAASSTDNKIPSGVKNKSQPKSSPVMEDIIVKVEAEPDDDYDSASFHNNDGAESEDIQMSEPSPVPSNSSYTDVTMNGDQETKKQSIVENILKRKRSDKDDLKVSFQWKDKNNTGQGSSRIFSKRKQTFPMQVKKSSIDIPGSDSETGFQQESPVPVNLFRVNSESFREQADKDINVNRLDSIDSDEMVEIVIEKEDEQAPLSGEESVYGGLTESASGLVYGSSQFHDSLPKSMRYDYLDVSPSASPFSSPEGYKKGIKSELKDGLLVSRGEGRYEKLIKCEICGKVCRTSNMARHKKRYCTRLPNHNYSGEDESTKTFADI